MAHDLIKAGAVALFVGGLAAGQAFAFSPVPVDRAAPFAIPVVDEQQQVNDELNAADMPAHPEGPAPQRAKVKERPQAAIPAATSRRRSCRACSPRRLGRSNAPD